MNKLTDSLKSAVIVALVLFLGTVSALRLMELQVVDGSEQLPVNRKSSSLTYTRSVPATRGEIVDYKGNVIIGNSLKNDIILHAALFPEDKKQGNEILLNTYNELHKRGFDVKLDIPVSDSTPYVFTGDDGENDDLKSRLNLNVYATAENCIDKLISDYEIDDSYSRDEKWLIAAMRYELLIKDFSYSNDFVLAEDVDNATVIEMKELGDVLCGVDAVQSAKRNIIVGNVMPHEIGTVGPIYADEYEELKSEGYAMNDVVGKGGIESAMEKELRGQKGSEKVTVTDGSISEVSTEKEAVSGNTVRLTVDGEYQVRLQNILDNFLANFQRINSKKELRGKDLHCGAIVVLDTKDNAVRGLATAPTYDLNDYKNDYDSVLNAENTPLVNRATDGLYLPGSTFKTITATAGLNEGTVDGNTTFFCNRHLDYMGTEYHCTGNHGAISMSRAIEVSCNIYFYELSSRLTIDNITKYASLYGLGQHTGIETGDAAGYLSNPETYSQRGEQWYIGYVLQAGIGNIGWGITPLQMACVASTVANEGVRYKPHLVDSLLDYGTDNVSMETEPVISEQIELNHDYVYDYIEQGMIAASHNMPARYSISNLGFDVAIKTGTPQTDNKGGQNSFFIGYAPADDPEMAFAGVIEGGEYSKYMIRDIITAYRDCYGLNGSAPKKSDGIPSVTTSASETSTGTGSGTETHSALTYTETSPASSSQASQTPSAAPQPGTENTTG